MFLILRTPLTEVSLCISRQEYSMGNSPLMVRKDYGVNEEKEAYRDPPGTTPPDATQGVLEAIKGNEGLMEALSDAVELSKSNPVVMDRIVQGVYETLRSIPGRSLPMSMRTVCAALDSVADRLEAAGQVEAAEKLDVIANTLEAGQE